MSAGQKSAARRMAGADPHVRLPTVSCISHYAIDFNAFLRSLTPKGYVFGNATKPPDLTGQLDIHITFLYVYRYAHKTLKTGTLQRERTQSG